MGRPRINTDEDKKRKAAARLKKWRAENPKKLAAQTARRRKKYGEKERVRSRHWYRKHPEVSRARVWPNNLKRFGMTPQSYLELFAAQGNVCASCGRPREPGERRFPVDHCHTTHEIRGILCHNCNLGLGQFKEDPSLLRAAIEYLARPRVVQFKLIDPVKYYELTRKRPKR